MALHCRSGLGALLLLAGLLVTAGYKYEYSFHMTDAEYNRILSEGPMFAPADVRGAALAVPWKQLPHAWP